jgi:hypothetical protein
MGRELQGPAGGEWRASALDDGDHTASGPPKNLGARPLGRYDDNKGGSATMWYFPVVLAVFVFLSGCASSSSQPPRSEFEDIPVPKGLTLDLDKSTVIESPTVKAARLMYKGRLEPDSLAVAFRTTLEANGWRHLSSMTSAGKGITQVYDKAGNSLQVMIYEGMYYTWVEVSATRVVTSSQLR